MKNPYRWLVIMLNILMFIFMLNNSINQYEYNHVALIFNDLSMSILLVIIFALNACHILCSGSSWLALYIKRKNLEEVKKIEELLQYKTYKSSYTYKTIKLLLVIGNILGFLFLVSEYADRAFIYNNETTYFFAFIIFFVSNIFYILRDRLYVFCWLSLALKRRKIEEEKIIKKLERQQ